MLNNTDITLQLNYKTLELGTTQDTLDYEHSWVDLADTGVDRWPDSPLLFLKSRFTGLARQQTRDMKFRPPIRKSAAPLPGSISLQPWVDIIYRL